MGLLLLCCALKGGQQMKTIQKIRLSLGKFGSMGNIKIIFLLRVFFSDFSLVCLRGSHRPGTRGPPNVIPVEECPL